MFEKRFWIGRQRRYPKEHRHMMRALDGVVVYFPHLFR